MPANWPAEALKAQAVAARTYAIVSLAAGRKKGQAWDVYADTRSQVYDGLGGEAPETSQAIDDTSGQVLTFDGTPAQTMYFSSSRRPHAERARRVRHRHAVPRSVADPWDDASPNHAWLHAAP